MLEASANKCFTGVLRQMKSLMHGKTGNCHNTCVTNDILVIEKTHRK